MELAQMEKLCETEVFWVELDHSVHVLERNMERFGMDFLLMCATRGKYRRQFMKSQAKKGLK